MTLRQRRPARGWVRWQHGGTCRQTPHHRAGPRPDRECDRAVPRAGGVNDGTGRRERGRCGGRTGRGAVLGASRRDRGGGGPRDAACGCRRRAGGRRPARRNADRGRRAAARRCAAATGRAHLLAAPSPHGGGPARRPSSPGPTAPPIASASRRVSSVCTGRAWARSRWRCAVGRRSRTLRSPVSTASCGIQAARSCAGPTTTSGSRPGCARSRSSSA